MRLLALLATAVAATVLLTACGSGGSPVEKAERNAGVEEVDQPEKKAEEAKKAASRSGGNPTARGSTAAPPKEQTSKSPAKAEGSFQAQNAPNSQRCPPPPVGSTLYFVVENEAGVVMVMLESKGNGTVEGEARVANPDERKRSVREYHSDITGTTSCGKVSLGIYPTTPGGLKGGWEGKLEGGPTGSLQLRSEEKGTEITLQLASEGDYERLVSILRESYPNGVINDPSDYNSAER